jgi:hypothetical protein
MAKRLKRNNDFPGTAVSSLTPRCSRKIDYEAIVSDLYQGEAVRKPVLCGGQESRPQGCHVRIATEFPESMPVGGAKEGFRTACRRTAPSSPKNRMSGIPHPVEWTSGPSNQTPIAWGRAHESPEAFPERGGRPGRLEPGLPSGEGGQRYPEKISLMLQVLRIWIMAGPR